MAIAAIILGVFAGLFGIGIELFGETTGGIGASGVFRLINIAVPIVSIIGGGLVFTSPLTGGILMLLSSMGLYVVFGYSFVTAFPIILGFIGGLTAIIAGDAAQGVATEPPGPVFLTIPGIKSSQDFGAGILFMLIGLAGIYFGRDLTYGSALRMGPGYFPAWLSWIILGLGAIIALRGVAFEGQPIEIPQFRPIIFILLSILIFGFMIARFGLAITTAVLVIFAAYARPNVPLKETAIFAVLLGVFATLAFVYGLGQPVPAWWGE